MRSQERNSVEDIRIRKMVESYEYWSRVTLDTSLYIVYLCIYVHYLGSVLPWSLLVCCCLPPLVYNYVSMYYVSPCSVLAVLMLF